MKNKRHVWLVLTFTGILGVTAWIFLVPRGPQEPIYQRKKLSEWLERYTTYQTSDRFQTHMAVDADQAVQQIGTNGLPVLLRLARAHDPGWKRACMALADRQHFVTVRFTTAAMKQQQAQDAFLMLGRRAVPALTELARDSDPATRIRYANWLKIIAPEAARQAGVK
jgi:hypothetical protein